MPKGRATIGRLKTAEEVAKVVKMSQDRILQLSRAEVLPHVRIDGGEPLFSLSRVKAYVRQHLMVEFEGAPLPLDMRAVVLKSVAQPVPIALTMVQDRLRECPAIDIPPCVYFLITGETILYVGQSCILPARLVQHSQAGRQWERALFLPVPETDLLKVEAYWIRVLNPSWNRARRLWKTELE